MLDPYMTVAQATFTQGKVKQIVGSLRSGPHDFFDLYNSLGLSPNHETDVQALLGVMFYAECVALGMSLLHVQKSAFKVIPEGLVFLASDPNNWYFHEGSAAGHALSAKISSDDANHRWNLARDLFDVRGHTDRFLIQLTDGTVRTGSDVDDLFSNAAFGGAYIVDVHGLAVRLRASFEGALFRLVR